MRYAKCARTECREESRQESKYCSTFCMKKHNNDLRPKAQKKIANCIVCGTRFIGRKDRQTCGSTCRTRLQKIREAKIA